ncbi:MAG: succinylglutamate desuccinylase/aspartoacylase family protein, partial [Nanoarchaeota archaeon]
MEKARKLRKKIRKRIKRKGEELEYSFIRILTGSDLSGRRIPLMSVKSESPGPVVWITACVHGDEVGGVVVIQEIFRRIRKTPLLKGSLYAFPLMNPMGFEMASRQVTISEEDLNRSFPGNENGSLAGRIADKIFSTIKETKPDLVIDLHNDWRESVPYTLIEPSRDIDKYAYDKTKFFSKLTGFPVIVEVEDVEKTLTLTLLKSGIPALTLELGECYVVNERDVEYGVKAVWDILVYLGMVEPVLGVPGFQLNERVKDKILKYSQEPTSPTSGIIRFLVKPGEIVKKGQAVAKIYNAFGKLLETLKALDDAIVLGYSDSSVAFPGRPVMAFGVLE